MIHIHTRLARLNLAVVTLAATITAAGCGGQSPKVLGAPPEAAANATVKTIVTAASGKSVTLHGEMTEKCPIAGCWFMLKDKTGIVRVDTKASGFVVSEVPVHSILTVTGTVVAGTDPGIAATGVRY